MHNYNKWIYGAGIRFIPAPYFCIKKVKRKNVSLFYLFLYYLSAIVKL